MNISSVINSPLVSIITAVKNGEKYLEESLESILNQTYTNFELIVIDDYSVDGTAGLLNKIASKDLRVRLIVNQGFSGLSNSLNLGIKLAKGLYIVRHDADDISNPNRLEVQVAHIQKKPHLDILGSNIEMVGLSGEHIKLHREPLSHSAILFHTLFGTPFAHPSVIIRKSFLDRNALSYLEVPAQDYELWVRMLNAGAYAENIPEALVKYRISPESDSNTRSLQHHLMAESLKMQQVLRYTRFSNEAEKFTSSSFQAIAHYLLTGNELIVDNNAQKKAKQVIEFFIAISSQMNIDETEKNQLVSAMNVRVAAIKSKIFDLEKLKKLGCYAKKLGTKAKHLKPAIELNSNEMQVFIENVHVFIIVRDRLACLEALINWLSLAGHKNIILIDNASTYPPLLEFLAATSCKVISLKENLGHTALWKIPELKEIISANWFVYTDPDVIPHENCPLDAVGKFYNVLLNNPNFVKAGFSLKIDDIPDHYHLKHEVIKWETQYYERPVDTDLFYADIDTTFSLNRPGIGYCYGPALRTAGSYVARHLPWYLDTNSLSSEELYYREHALPSVTTWNVAGDVKPLILPTKWSKLKNKILIIASHNSVSYKLAIQAKRILGKLKILK